MSEVPHTWSLTIDQDWTYFDPPENLIVQFLAKHYDKDKQRTLYVFKTLGLPFDQNKTIVQFI